MHDEQHAPMCVLSRVCPFAAPGTAASQALLSIGFPRQELWSGWPRPPAEELPSLGVEPTSLASSELAGKYFTNNTTWEAQDLLNIKRTGPHLYFCLASLVGKVPYYLC